MIELTFTKPFRKIDTEIFGDLKEVDVLDVCYHLFLGTVTFRLDGLDLSPDWGVLPVVDFASAMLRVVEVLRTGRSEQFEYTHSDDLIFFHTAGDGMVTISSNYRPGRCIVGITEFSDAVDRMSFELLTFLREEHADIFGNTEFLDWYPGVRDFNRLN